MPRCAVSVCRNKSSSNNLGRGGVSYHRFPNDPKIKAEWILATGNQNWMPGKTSTICSVHFESNDFVIKDGGRRYLNSKAIPLYNLVTCQKNVDVSEMNETKNGVTSIEVEVMPENNSFENNGFPNETVDSVYPRTHEEDKQIIEVMQAKIREQELMIRKLKLRNCRLKKRLFSLKSMEN